MIPRRLRPTLHEALAEAPAVGLLGPRQAGKTTLALEVAKGRASVYLDLESEADRAKLAEPELYLPQHGDKLVILDEVQRTPELFRSLRGLIDAGRRRGLRRGRFLVLGSASMDLLQQSSESLDREVNHASAHPSHRRGIPDAEERRAEASRVSGPERVDAGPLPARGAGTDREAGDWELAEHIALQMLDSLRIASTRSSER